MLKRALFRGKIARNYPDSGTFDVMRSLLAVLIYTLFLPISVFIGQHVFMKYLIKSFDHLGKILAYLGIDVIREKYVTG